MNGYWLVLEWALWYIYIYFQYLSRNLTVEAWLLACKDVFPDLLPSAATINHRCNGNCSIITKHSYTSIWMQRVYILMNISSVYSEQEVWICLMADNVQYMQHKKEIQYVVSKHQLVIAIEDKELWRRWLLSRTVWKLIITYFRK